MKIRIKGNTVRFRLSKPEVELFSSLGYLEEQTEFINGCLVYAIRSSDTEHLSAGFINNHLTVFVPRHQLQEWASTNTVAIDHHMPLPGGKDLYLLVEKDFKCIDSTEDQSDYFENPAKVC